MNFQTLTWALTALFLVIAIFNLIVSKRRIKKIETQIISIEFEPDDQQKLIGIQSVSSGVSQVKSNILLMTIGLLLLWATSLLASPYFSKFFCNQLIHEKTYNINIKINKNENGQILPVPDAIIEVNKVAENPPTDLEGKTVVKFYQRYSKFPGCECDDVNKVDFVIIYDKDKVFSHSETLSTEWFTTQTTNPSTLEITVNQ